MKAGDVPARIMRRPAPRRNDLLSDFAALFIGSRLLSEASASRFDELLFVRRAPGSGACRTDPAGHGALLPTAGRRKTTLGYAFRNPACEARMGGCAMQLAPVQGSPRTALL
jgi:hypothetical protein